MVSPFPGMDPYLEDPAIWPDFHGTFLVYLRTDLNSRLPKHYIARWDRHVWIDGPEYEQPQPNGKPDIYVADSLNRSVESSQTTILDAPATVQLPAVDLEGKPFLKIIDIRGRRVVTVFELLSHANKKRGRDRDAYLAKRLEYFKTGVNLVEMDFLRSGTRPEFDSDLAPADYYIFVCRAIDYPNAAEWPISVLDELPLIPVPLDPGMEPVMLPIKPSFDLAFKGGGFADEIDYREPAKPPLSEKVQTWLRERLNKHDTNTN